MSTSEHTFCRNWLFCRGDIDDASRRAYDDHDWNRVDIPHTWNDSDMYPGQPHEDAYVGPAWYRKSFELDPPADDECVFLVFEGVANRSSVWVDGQLVGGRNGGFLSFRIDLTNALDDTDKHVVAVRADNSFEWGSMPPKPIDWERYGGIYRPVRLIRRRGAHLAHKGVEIRTPEVSAEEASIEVTTEIAERRRDDRPVHVYHTLRSPEGETVSSGVEHINTVKGRSVSCSSGLPPIKHPELWSPEDPALYSLETQIIGDEGEVLDTNTEQVGLRWTTFDPEEGFALNGQPMKLRGVDAHQEYPGLGWACPERFHRREAKMLKSAGINFTRASHYPRHEAFLRACDELGIMVMEEQPFWHGALRVQHGPDFKRYVRWSMREMVRQHGNHPSIIMWNTVNEIMLVLAPQKPHPDPDRRTESNQLNPDEWPFAHSCLSAMYDELKACDPDRPVSMVVGGYWDLNEEAGLTDLADIVAYNGGAFHADIENEPVYDVLKRQNPDRISMMSEGILNAQEGRPERRDDWEWQQDGWRQYAEDWSRIYERDWFCGGAMWVFADYSAKGRMRHMGMVDFWRLPYAGYYFFQSQWSDDLMAHIMGHWEDDEGLPEQREVVVFTNADSAELLLNGESLGENSPDDKQWPQLPHPPIIWNVPFAPGQLEVRVERAGTTCKDDRITSAHPSSVQITPENGELAGDGQDISFINVSVVDDNGHRCYTSSPSVDIEVSGTAQLAGPKRLTARAGSARFAVRSTGQPGSAKLKVSSEELCPGQATLDVVPAD